MSNDFITARGEIAARIKRLRSELEHWEEELAAFDRVEATMKNLSKSGHGQASKAFRLNGGATASFLPRAAESQRGDLTKLVLESVKTSPGMLSTKNVIDHILGQGFKPKGRNFGITVYKTLKRLAEKKQIQEVNEPGTSKVLFHA